MESVFCVYVLKILTQCDPWHKLVLQSGQQAGAGWNRGPKDIGIGGQGGAHGEETPLTSFSLTLFQPLIPVSFIIFLSQVISTHWLHAWRIRWGMEF